MAKVDKSKVCTECLTQPRRQRKGKVFPLCDDCRPIIIGRKWKIRKLKRTLMEGALVQFHTADGGWRAGYLLKMREMRADVQPVGAIGKVPDVVVVNIDALKLEPNPSKLWPTVDDFYRANKRSKPVVLVSNPESAARNEDVSKYFRDRKAADKPFTQRPTSDPVQKVNTVVNPTTPKPVAEKNVRTAHAPFNAEEAVRLYVAKVRMKDIIAAVQGTRATGATGNLVRAACIAAGVYVKP